MSFEKFDDLKNLASEISQREGCFLYHIDVRLHGKGRKVCVYIDKNTESAEDSNRPQEGESPRGASVEDCANVSRGLSLLLDVEDLIPGEEYELEVSTPGLERILQDTWHFEKVLNEIVQVKTNVPVIHPEQKNQKRGIKTIKGELLTVDDEGIKVKSVQDKLEWNITFDQIHKANLIYGYIHPGKK
ncbi:MAG: ribosome maturation factor RimP [Bdellovibrionaceae bacterium]|jgi:ribosome maturation factor RimP|nr:ribosome maturation factor RimP [Pseudobdellovibrionaceae bacterium]